MAAPSDELTVTYEQLADLEKDFELAEAEIIRHQHALTKELYKKRQETVSKIPYFWRLVLEQAPPDVDQYIQPADAAVLLNHLTSFSVSRFEIEDNKDGQGDPRSLAIKLEFSENDHFDDRMLEKKFWHRHRPGWSGLVSEPVPIRWKQGKDLTAGLLDLVMKVWSQDQKWIKSANGSNNSSKKKKVPLKPDQYTPEQKALAQKIEATGISGASFFSWFGFRGMNVSAEENKVEIERRNERRRLKAEGKMPADEDENEEDDDDEDDPLALEIFPDGDELATAFSEDLWPDAIKYFTQAQEQDAPSDGDFEELEDELDAEDDGEDDASDEPPAKKRKAT